MPVSLPLLIRVLAVLLLATAAGAATTSTVVDIPASSGGTQRFLHVRPDAPIANIIAVPGGDGILGIQNDGSMPTITGQCGPVMRNRLAFADRRFALALVDGTSNGVVRNAEDVRQVARYMRARDNVPTWVIGGSAATPVTTTLALTLPAEGPLGVVYFSTAEFSASQVTQIRQPTFVIYHSFDIGNTGAQLFNTLTTTKERSIQVGGSNTGCGYHLFNGLDAEFVAATAGFMERYNNALAPVGTFNVQGLWWRSPASSESGWGVNLVHQGDTLFGTWFTYDADGSDLWLFMDNLQLTANNTYAGDVYRASGSPFGLMPYDATRFSASKVGTASIAFADANNGTMTYTVSGVTQVKPIVKFVYSSPVPTCVAGAATGTVSYQDLWWRSPALSENGSGVNIVHQGNILFVTWFTYDTDGSQMWLFMDNAARSAPGVYSGAVFQARGSPINLVPYDTTRFAPTNVGTGTIAFADNNNGTFTYTVKGVTESKPITRFVYSAPLTTCTFPAGTAD